MNASSCAANAGGHALSYAIATRVTLLGGTVDSAAGRVYRWAEL